MKVFLAEISIKRPGVVRNVTAAIHDEMRRVGLSRFTFNAFLLSHYATRDGRLVHLKRDGDCKSQPGDQHLFTVELLAPNICTTHTLLPVISAAVQHGLNIPVLQFRVRITTELALMRQDI